MQLGSWPSATQGARHCGQRGKQADGQFGRQPNWSAGPLFSMPTGKHANRHPVRNADCHTYPFGQVRHRHAHDGPVSQNSSINMNIWHIWRNRRDKIFDVSSTLCLNGAPEDNAEYQAITTASRKTFVRPIAGAEASFWQSPSLEGVVS